jgi:hypothetical protein
VERVICRASSYEDSCRWIIEEASLRTWSRIGVGVCEASLSPTDPVPRRSLASDSQFPFERPRFGQSFERPLDSRSAATPARHTCPPDPVASRHRIFVSIGCDVERVCVFLCLMICTHSRAQIIDGLCRDMTRLRCRPTCTIGSKPRRHDQSVSTPTNHQACEPHRSIHRSV